MAFHAIDPSYIEMESLWKKHYRNSDGQISLPKQLTDSFDFLVMKSWGFLSFSLLHLILQRVFDDSELKVIIILMNL